MGWRQTSVSHSSAESEVISLYAGPRMDGLTALDPWNLAIEVLHSSKNLPVRRDPWREETRGKDINTKTKKHVNRVDVELFNVYHVITNAKLSHFEAMLYICDDNEAVIKMITIGGRPTMRHVSRTHRVALDWLFDIK